jgi:hypothetical protein
MLSGDERSVSGVFVDVELTHSDLTFLEQLVLDGSVWYGFDRKVFFKISVPRLNAVLKKLLYLLDVEDVSLLLLDASLKY